MRNEIVYRLDDGIVARRETPYNVCFDFNKSLGIRIADSDGNGLALIARVKGETDILTIKANSAGVFELPADCLMPGVTILLDLVESRDDDSIGRAWILEPIDVIALINMQDKVFLALQNYEFAKKRIDDTDDKCKKIEGKIIELEKLNNDLTARITELERLFATITEVIV